MRRQRAWTSATRRPGSPRRPRPREPTRWLPAGCAALLPAATAARGALRRVNTRRCTAHRPADGLTSPFSTGSSVAAAIRCSTQPSTPSGSWEEARKVPVLVRVCWLASPASPGLRRARRARARGPARLHVAAGAAEVWCAGSARGRSWGAGRRRRMVDACQMWRGQGAHR